jgi:hypothetical protein
MEGVPAARADRPGGHGSSAAAPPRRARLADGSKRGQASVVAPARGSRVHYYEARGRRPGGRLQRSEVYDALTTRYAFSCPRRGEARVRLSAFRELERLPGAAHPALYQVVFECSCGEEHPGLVSDDELDWAPLGLGEGGFGEGSHC